MLKGNVTFVSNLYPVKDNILDDVDFLKQIKDPFCLEKMVKNPTYMNKLSSEQRSIFAQAGGHCEYAEKGDYPWGTIILKNGKMKNVCKCTKKDCFLYGSCRSTLSN